MADASDHRAEAIVGSSNEEEESSDQDWLPDSDLGEPWFCREGYSGMSMNGRLGLISLVGLQNFVVNKWDNTESYYHLVTELDFNEIRLISQPSDGGLMYLRTFFARTDNSRLTAIRFDDCNFGTPEQAAHLFTVFHTNTTVTRMVIKGGASAPGSSLAGLMLNMPQLQEVVYMNGTLSTADVRAFQPVLRENRNLKKLKLFASGSMYRHRRAGGIRDDGIRLIADALVGNTTMKVLDIGWNGITHVGLDAVTRILESAQLESISLRQNPGIFNDEARTQRFSRILSRHDFLKGLDLCECGLENKGLHLIVDGLVHNTTLKAIKTRGNVVTLDGLAEFTRLLESTRLQTMEGLGVKHGVKIFLNENNTRKFVSALDRNPFVQTLQMTDGEQQDLPDATLANINHILKRNQQLNRVVDLLLAPPPPPPTWEHHQQNHRHHHHHRVALLMLKIWHKAITKFANVPNNAGTSAIFQLLTARPQVLEKRLQRPAVAAAMAAAITATVPPVAAAAVAVSQEEQERKRRRLL
jgi:hypothetical protein